jgi:hypothetical protein
MASLLALILIAGLFLFLIWYFFYRSVLWAAEPLIKHFENREKQNGSWLRILEKRALRISI